MFEFVRTLPKKDHQLCTHLTDKAEGYIKVQLSGGWYWIPVTKDMKKFFGMTRNGNHITCGSWNRDKAFEHSMMDTAWAIYLQMRDVIGHEIKEELSRELQAGFARMFEKKIKVAVDAQIKDRMPKEIPYKKDSSS